MRKRWLVIAIAAVLPSLPLTGSAHGCIKGAAVGGVVGHVAGHHAVAGAVAGCVIGHHHAKVKDTEAAAARPQQEQDSTAKSTGAAPAS